MFIFLLRCALHFFLSRRLFHRRHHYIRTSGGGWQEKFEKSFRAAKDHIKQLKQRILALCTRWRKEFNGTKKCWTVAHMKWLQHLEFDNPVAQETFDEYVIPK
jgi:hypothetical protein